MTDEIELKLRLPEIIAGKKASYTPAKIAAAFGVSQDKPKQSQHLISTYFDTEDEWLRQHGMALRIRQIGRQRIQTLKAPTGEVAGAQAYLEVETPIVGDVPDLAMIGDEVLQQQLKSANIADRLHPVFTSDFRRTAWTIDFDGSTIELAFDRGKIVVDHLETPINEVELELKAGAPAALFSLAEVALDQIPLCLGHETKAARGYRLRSGQQPGPVKARQIDLPMNCDVGDAFTLFATQCLALLRANELAVIGNEDPESIHQFRVTLRRLRSLVRAYRDLMDELVYRHLAGELRWLQLQLGPARDLDVFITETLVPIRDRFPALTALKLLIDVAEKRRAIARHQAHLTLQVVRYNRLQMTIYRWLATGAWRRGSATASLGASAVDFADRLLKKQHKRMRRLGGDGDIPEAELHELRVAGKKMRYLGDGFRSFYKPKAFRKFHLRLATMPDCLGGLTDAFVGDRLMVDLIAELQVANAVSESDIAHLRGLISGWQARRIADGLKHFDEEWQGFRKADVYWKRD
jgi:inorganic triphosphatase YgiF